MANKIKGLIVEIGGDTTQLGKALEGVNKKTRDISSELGEVNRLLRFDPGNSDLLAQKQQVLADAVSNTSEKLAKLKEAERQVQEQFQRGEVSAEQVRALQREIIATENKLSGYENAARETAEAIESLGKASAETLQETAELKTQVSDLAATGFKGVTATVGAAVAALTAATESTREYRTEMGKLDTAFTDNGFSVDAARSAYTELQSVLGETDQAVEAANHLAKLTENEKDLATWTGDILPGVFATFGASLPIEGLTEAANETAKVGAVTGPLADALNWAGISEDAFNESLAKCTTEQERQALITKTLAETYGAASAAYRETNADVIAANAANEAWTASLAQVGASVEPLVTEVKMMGAALLTDVVPVIQTLLNNLPIVGVTLAGLAASVAAFKIAAIAATAATQGMTLAQYAATAAQSALNVALNANPIGLVILALTGLVAAFMYLWKNSEDFRNFWTDLWNKITAATSAAVDWLKNVPERVYDALKGAIDRVQNWGGDMVAKAKETASKFLNTVTGFFSQLPGQVWSFLLAVITHAITWRVNLINAAIQAASSFLSSVASYFSQLPGKVQTYLANALSKVTAWVGNLARKGREAASGLVSAVVNGLKGLPSQLMGIGGDLVAGLWNGLNGKLSWLKDKVSSFASSVLSSMKKAFGVNSPSRETEWLGDMLDQGLAKGVEDNALDPIRAMQRVSGQVLDAASTDMDGMAVGYRLNRQTSQAAAATTADSGLGAKLDAILSAIERGQVLTIDGAALVGATAARYDTTLGQRRALAARGAV